MKPARLSLRALAKRLGVSHTAVSKAVAAGRLARSVGRDAKGLPFIANAEVAAQEWAQNVGKPSPQNSGGRVLSLADAQRDVARERARGLRLTNDIRRGQYVVLADAEREWGLEVAAIRSHLLGWEVGLADKIHRAATLGGVAAVAAVLKEAVYQVLTELATGRHGSGRQRSKVAAS